MENDIFVLEYSKKQNAFHRSTLGEMIKNNRDVFDKKIDNPWMPIAMGSWEDMALLGQKLQKEIYDKNILQVNNALEDNSETQI